jgi:hypothetical protein
MRGKTAAAVEHKNRPLLSRAATAALTFAEVIDNAEDLVCLFF